MTDRPDPHVTVIAGEPSGDLLGGRLIGALRGKVGARLRIDGIGGEAMTAAGLSSWFPMRDLSVMGLAEVLRHLPRLMSRLSQTVAAIEADPPDMLVTIDAPDFCFRVVQRLKRRGKVTGTRFVHLVAPTVWAWRPGRAAKIARFLDHLLVLLPFEPPYFERHGLGATFIGHPVVEGGADRGDGPGFRNRHGIATDRPLLLLLPGSRRGEIDRMLPVFVEAAARLHASVTDLEVVVPTLPDLADVVSGHLARAHFDHQVVTAVAERFDAFAAGDLAIAASGTVAQELALAGTPMVIGYRLNPVTAWIARRLVKVPYVTLINLIVEEGVIPERLLEACTPDALAAAAAPLMRSVEGARQVARAAEALTALGRGGPSPGARAADAILKLLDVGRADAVSGDAEDKGDEHKHAHQ